MKLTQQGLEELIQTHGLKMTPQRRAIVECLEAAHHHPTAEEVFSVVNSRFPMTSRATVYNTLHLLKEAHLVQEVFENGVSRFDPNLTHHHHFICRQCGKVEDLEETGADATPLPPELNGLIVETVEMTFRGLCAECAPEKSQTHPSKGGQES